MTAPGRYASNDGTFARSTGNAAARGGALIGVAIVIGILLLWKGGVGGDDSSAAIQDDSADSASGDTGSTDESSTGTDDASDDTGDSSGDATDDESLAVDDGTGDDAATETPPVTPTARPVGEVKVMVANAAGVNGIAGTQTGILTTAGYVAVAVNAAVATEISTVYYVDGYDVDALGVALALNGSEVHLRPAPPDPVALVAEGGAIGNEDAHIWVVLGSDRALG